MDGIRVPVLINPFSVRREPPQRPAPGSEDTKVQLLGAAHTRGALGRTTAWAGRPGARSIFPLGLAF